MTLKEKFEAAVAASKNLSEKPDNETLLKIYSAYKQATEGDAPDDGNYGMFDFVAKVKHEAWKKLKGESSDAAMERYISLIKVLENK